MPSLKRDPMTGIWGFGNQNEVINNTTGQTLDTISDPSATNPAQEEYIANTVAKSGTGQYGVGEYIGDANVNAYYDPATGQGVEKYPLGPTDYANKVPQDEAPGYRGEVVDGGGTPTEPVKSAADIAFDKYLASLTESSELTDAKKRLGEMDTAAALAYEGALEKGDTLGFARGEAGLTQRQNAILRAGQAASVQAYAELDKKRGEISKAQYEYEKSKIDAEAEANKDFSLSEGQTRWGYNPKTGKYEQIAAGPTDTKDDAYRDAQIRNIESQIREREKKGLDDGKYTITEKDKNSLRAYGISEEEIGFLQEDIRKHTFRVVWEAQTDQNIKDALELILDPQGKLGS